MKLGCCIQRAEDIPEVQAAGYDYYEFAGKQIVRMNDQTFEQLVKINNRLGFSCAGFNSYCDGTPAVVGPGFHLKEAAKYAEKICARGKQLGIRTIGIGAPAARCLPPGYSMEYARRQCREFLRVVAFEAEKCGIQLLFEAVNDRVCNFAVYTRDAAEIVRQLALPNLGMVLDFYHMHVMGEPLENGALALPHLRHAHISTCGPRLQRGYPGANHRRQYEEIFYWLKTHGYDLTVSIEADVFAPNEAAMSAKMLREVDALIQLHADRSAHPAARPL